MEIGKNINNKVYLFCLIGFFSIVALSILVLPLYSWFIPFNWGKTIAFRIILSVLIFFFLWQVLFKNIKLSTVKNKIKSVSLPFWFLISFLLISTLATIFSLDVGFSLWGSPMRGDGFANFIFYIIFSLLTFLIIRKNDWQKLWDFTIIIAILISLIAIFQQFGIFKEFLSPIYFRPSSTLGNPIFLAIYLLLLTFLSLSFAIKSKSIIRKIFYFLSFLIFFGVSVFLAQTRAAFLGLAIGSIWFLFVYPKRWKKIKIFSAIFLIILIFGMQYLNSHFYILKNQPENIRSATGRILSTIGEPREIIQYRISVWKVSLNALKERPILGYGPENFEIAFNKYYDPSLPGIGAVVPDLGIQWYKWWDRAHNFLFDISITVGLPGLIIYLCFFLVLFWQLQKLKKKEPEAAIVSHGLQATFIGYLTANLFSFDCVDVYLILFLLIGYTFYLISSGNVEKLEMKKGDGRPLLSEKLYQYRKIIAFFIFLFLAWFIFIFNIKPLKINKELNSAYSYLGSKNYEEAIKTIDRISLDHSIIDNYVRTSFTDIIQEYNQHNFDNPKLAASLTRKSIWFLQENIKINPNRLRDWLLAGENVNFLISQKKILNNNFINTEELLTLKKEANYYFDEASLLSPKRQDVYTEWAKTGLLTQDYQVTKEKAQKCIDLNQNYGVCYWLMALSNGYLKNDEQFNYYLNIAKEKKYDTESEGALIQLINMHIENKDYKGLVDYYQKLISVLSDDNKKAQIYASLAAVYKEMGEFEKAKSAALKALDFQPTTKTNIDEFLKTLK